MGNSQYNGYNPLRFFWIAHYEDETCLPQYDPETLEENLFKEVDQSKLVKFGWYPFPPDFAMQLIMKGENIHYPGIGDDLPTFEIELNPSRKLIVFRRNKVRMLTGKHVDTVYALGWEENIEGKTHKSIMFIKEDGSVLLTDDYQKVL